MTIRSSTSKCNSTRICNRNSSHSSYSNRITSSIISSTASTIITISNHNQLLLNHYKASCHHHFIIYYPSFASAPRRRRRGPIPTSGTTALLPKRDGDEFCTRGDLPAACRAVTKLPGAAGTGAGRWPWEPSPASHPWWLCFPCRCSMDVARSCRSLVLDHGP